MALHLGNCPKIINTLFHTFLVLILFFMQLFPKILSGIANKVDPEQTQKQSELGLHCLHMPCCQTFGV